MVDVKIVREWLDKADEDFNFASVNMTYENTFYSQICFHFQQAAEKYLKTFIVANDLKFVKTHDLVQLRNICTCKGCNLEIEDECVFLTDFYIETRYPVHWPSDIDRQEALKAQSAARKIADTIKNLLK